MFQRPSDSVDKGLPLPVRRRGDTFSMVPSNAQLDREPDEHDGQ
jgi:hypothetical protein